MPETLRLVQVLGVAEDRLGYDFVLLMDEGERRLPIWISRCDALRLARIVAKVPEPRPQTHPLILGCLRDLGGTVSRALIDDLWQNIFYAKLVVTKPDGTDLKLDCRPADALALALLAEAPVFVPESILAEAHVGADLPPDSDDPETSGADPWTGEEFDE